VTLVDDRLAGLDFLWHLANWSKDYWLDAIHIVVEVFHALYTKVPCQTVEAERNGLTIII
jgi:hypothetical protein